jgi:hypothetical protein
MPFEWAMAVDHLPLGTTGRNYFVGHGCARLVGSSDDARIVNDATWGRPVFGTNWDKSFDILVPGLTEITLGFRARAAGTLQAGSPAVLRDIHGAVVCSLYYNGSALEFRSGATILATGTTTLAGFDGYIEVWAKVHATEGAFEVRINGVTEIADSNVNTADGAGIVSVVDYGGLGANFTQNWRTTDFYIRETVGPGFWGPVFLRRMDFDSDILAQWARNAGADNYSRLTGVVDTSSYVESDTLGQRDEYGVADLPSGSNSVIGVVRYAVSQAPAGGAPQVYLGLKRGANEELGEPRTVGVSAIRSQAVYHGLQPNGQPWSPAAVDDIVAVRESV